MSRHLTIEAMTKAGGKLPPDAMLALLWMCHDARDRDKPDGARYYGGITRLAGLYPGHSRTLARAAIRTLRETGYIAPCARRPGYCIMPGQVVNHENI